MATNVVRWLRDYLTARDLDTEVAGGLAVQQMAVQQLAVQQLAVEHLSHKSLPLERLPHPLPKRVRSAAITSFIVFGALCGLGALYVIGGAIAVVVMPLTMGREGVGTAMITLFTVCVTFVLSGILLLATRSAARVIRRERRGVPALYGFSVAAVIVLVLATAITQWLSVAFWSADNTDAGAMNWSIPIRLIEVLAIALFVHVALVIRGFERELTSSPVN